MEDKMEQMERSESSPQLTSEVWERFDEGRGYLHQIDVESLLVWTYRDQRADIVLGWDFESDPSGAAAIGRPLGFGRDSLAALERVGALGVRVDGGGPSSDAVNIDAEATHRAVTRLGRETATLVVYHARLASRPDDHITIRRGRFVAARDAQGRTVLEDRSPKKNNDRNYAACKLVWIPPSNTAFARRNYRHWHDAMSALATDLRDQLWWYTVLAPRAPSISPKLGA
jgi:hypothetical protein